MSRLISSFLCRLRALIQNFEFLPSSVGRRRVQGSAASALQGASTVADCAPATSLSARRIGDTKQPNRVQTLTPPLAMPGAGRLRLSAFASFFRARLAVSVFLAPLTVGTLALLLLLVGAAPSGAQTELAGVYGRVTDASGAVIVDAEVEIKNVDTNQSVTVKTNQDGLYTIPSLRPGHYLINVRKPGFKSVTVTEMTLNVQDNVVRNFALQVGSIAETVTVRADDLHINTTDGAVSTVVDRQFAENLPMNGRSFQTLIELTPGVVVTPASFTDPGQFSVNGQRASANYFTVDGVSANIGLPAFGGLSQGAGGAIPGFSVLGGTNNLVSQDALQEFRIQTSTYAPEFGRTPGAQVSIATRSGTNEFHGALFEFLRNNVLDANDWFSNQKGLPRSPERINDFGGVLGGPIIKNRTFFFFSYEGQRLRLPQTGITTVPSLSARQSAAVDIQPFLNAYPLPNGSDLGNGQAEFNAGFSDRSSMNATSFRIDYTLKGRLTLFGRYNHAPSELVTRRGLGGLSSLSTIGSQRIKTQTLTSGATWAVTPARVNDFRFNYSRTSAGGFSRLDTLGGATVPPDSILFPAGFSSKNAQFSFFVLDLQGSDWGLGRLAENRQQQFNVVDSVSLQTGAHSLKFGVDYRRLSPAFGPAAYSSQVAFQDVPSVLARTPAFVFIVANRGGSVLFRNLSAFLQDTWKVIPRLVLTYGLRWDVDFAPSTINGPDLLAVTQFDDLSALALAPTGTPVFKTKYNNFAPRVGAAYELRQAKGWETVVRGGFGLFYDLATQQIGDALFGGTFPFGASTFILGQPFGGANLGFPLDPAITQPPPISLNSLKSGTLVAFNPDLKLPRVYQWNVTLEKSLGNNQKASMAYLAAVGRRLIQPEEVFMPNPNFGGAELVRNGVTSDYHSLQVQFERRLSQGVQGLASYTWSHSIDTASSSSALPSNLFVAGLSRNANRGSSDFDVRHSFSAAVTWNLPAPRANRVLQSVLGNWSVDNIIQARSGVPVDVFNGNLFSFSFGKDFATVRPDAVAGVPLFLSDRAVAGHRRINAAAFVDPPIDPVTGFPLREGTLGRNALRGFGASQWDFAVRRQFALSESWGLQFRAEFFNLLNHPNFANPIGDLSNPLFGQSITMLARGLGGGAFAAGSGAFNPIFQIGGPRSIQFALKLQF